MKTSMKWLAPLLLAIPLSACGGDEPPPFDARENLLTIEDQTPENPSEIIVSEVLAESAGYVVIHDADEEGELGEPLGALPVEAGSATDLTIELARPLLDQELLYGSLYLSEDNAETFEPDDALLAIDRGEPVRVQFTVSIEVEEIAPALVVEDQIADPINEVVIAEVASDVDAWIIIRADDEGTPADVIASAPIEAGTYEDVRVALSRDAFEGETLHASLHIDAVADDDFDPEADIVVMVDEEPLQASFVVTLPELQPVASISVDNQSVSFEAADSIVIAAAKLQGFAGWIAIYADEGGEPGELLASELFSAGELENITIALDEALAANATLHARIHQESPADGNFTFDGENDEDPIVVVDEEPVMATFDVTLIDPSAPQLTAEDQLLESLPLNEVTIAELVYDQAGWLAIYDAEDTILGAVAVAADPAVKANIVATLDRDVVDNELLRVVLHADANAGDAFDAQADLPVLDATETGVEASFTVELLENSLEARDQALNEVSTEVRIDALHAAEDVILEIFAEADDSVLLAEAALGYGIHQDIALTLGRPLVDGEVIVAQLFVLEEGARVPAEDDAGNPVRVTFEVTVPDGTPAVFLTFSANSTNYRVSAVRPAGYVDIVSGGSDADNPTITLFNGWRYGINNTVYSTHPLEFGIYDNPPLGFPTFNALLSQDGSGSYDDDSQVNRVADGQRLWFTLSQDLVDAGLSTYRSGETPVLMRGDITIEDAPALTER
ncbi:hypothetical protein FRC98_10575 [Lujinxingia vulgaris]|uniref:DUF7282 domain-containing protein n=1 Tax=Lujinxingia vulgaris TaxID=2600176 RepID=A0A5C6X5J9_9DELT|nr:hypothetical protein [Lujinxingia vulgaris]TXD37169.1 hypothetical protein FRC98_10575 [Lujinxingia vulgaris]